MSLRPLNYLSRDLLDYDRSLLHDRDKGIPQDLEDITHSILHLSEWISSCLSSTSELLSEGSHNLSLSSPLR